MYRYDGLVVYQSHDDEGILEVVEQFGIRSLHFGSSSRQSSMALDDPECLQLPYTRAMTGWLLFKESINHALVVGLGGGSLVRHLLYHFPDCFVRVVEYRSSVVKIARSHFGLPLDSRLKVVVDDGGSYVLQQAQARTGQFDLLLLDAFDVDGLAKSIANLDFFQAAKALLTDDGILVANLWSSETRVYKQCIDWFNSVFNGRVLLLPVRNRGNVIAFALNGGIAPLRFSDLQSHARALEAKYHIEFPLFLKELTKLNKLSINPVLSR